jgi:hypothetical protein
MGFNSEKSRTVLKNAVGFMTASATSFARPLLVAAPLVATALFFATGTNAQTSGSAAMPNPPAAATTVVPIDAPAAASRKGPKGAHSSDHQGRAVAPATTDPAVTPTPEPEAAPQGRRKGPKGRSGSGRTEAAPVPDTQPAARRKEGPKGASGSDHDGRTEVTPDPGTQPTGQRKEGPKGAVDHGRTSATPAPDTQPTGRRKGPKGAGSSDHQGRTSATPLIIGALGAAASLALVVSGGNDRPASP